VVDVLVLSGAHVVGVLFGQNFPVGDRLNGSVVVVLVDLAIDRLLVVLMTGRCYTLILNGGVDGLVNGSIVLSILGKEVSYCCLCLLHFN